MITEIYVTRTELPAFMEDARVALRKRDANVVYGTVRMIEKDDESVPGVGAGPVRVRHLQPPHRARAGADSTPPRTPSAT